MNELCQADMMIYGVIDKLLCQNSGTWELTCANLNDEPKGKI